ncbi:94cc6962-0219-4aa7-a7ff-2e8dc5f01d68 [Sclerotinia trifoliorum]|uniref:94cc6962-0219-4aa7-a7ff-2e8dc5f01d68 n=1 Tax=Sclerotinia trifoliorum TaxID=28548 RepID=A0A8H2ZJW9_9HELO|nr:94cc6962-0219-4aa7-a7ff-2e8dc5f01d68 [Sclerotinia trifoliorum]
MVRRDDSSMKGGLKNLAKEAGITPCYLCRVFKKIMGVTQRQQGSLEAPVERIEGGPAEEDVGNNEDALDLNLDFEEWFWTSLSDSVYGRSIEEHSILPMTA